MRRMIWYEWKRIWNSRLTQFAVAGCILFFVFSAWSNIRLAGETDQNGNLVTGLEAVEVMKEYQKDVTLDQETADKYAEEYLAYTQNPDTSTDNRDMMYLSEEMYLNWYIPNRHILRPVVGAYRAAEQYNDSMRDVLSQSAGKDLYEARKDRVQENLNSAVSRNEITASEADWWNEKDNEVGQYATGYNRAWWELLNSSSLIILIMMAVSIGIAPMFAGEYQTKCDSLLLGMRYGKSRLILAKLISSFLFTTVVYWVSMGIFSGIYLAVMGLDGWNLPVQALYEDMSIGYNLTAAEACGLILVMGYIMIFGVMGVVLILSSLMKNPYGVIITTFLFLCVPLFLSLNRGGYLWKHVLALLPEKISEFSFSSYLVYSVGGLTVTWPVAAMIVNGLCAVVLSGAAYVCFRRHQVNR